MAMQVIRAQVKDEAVGQLRSAVDKVFAELDALQPEGIRYASLMEADGTSFLILLEIEDGVTNPLPTIEAFRDFQSALPTWLAGPPAVDAMGVVGSYRVF